MSNIRTLSVLILFLLAIQTLSADYNRYLTPQTEGGACLDGSAPAYYFDPGFGGNQKNFVIYFQGGGFCGSSTLDATLQSCYQRSSTDLGSSNPLPKTFNGKGFGLLSPQRSENSDFYDWNRIAVTYCDGSEFAGYRENPIQYKGKLLYFRGSRNVIEVFTDLNKRFSLYSADKVLISGGSAGGMATFQWTNYLNQHVKGQVYSVPDSGLFITDYVTPLTNQKQLRKVSQPLLSLVNNETEMPDPIRKCLKQGGFDVVDCFNAANYAKFIQSPIFMIQSAYDSWSIKYILRTKCLANKNDPFSLKNCDEDNLAAIQGYRKALVNYLHEIKGNRKNVGVWSPSCAQHCFAHTIQSWNSPNYVVNGRTLNQAIKRFIDNPNEAEWLLDTVAWPGNAGCNGLSSQKLNLRQFLFIPMKSFHKKFIKHKSTTILLKIENFVFRNKFMQILTLSFLKAHPQKKCSTHAPSSQYKMTA